MPKKEATNAVLKFWKNKNKIKGLKIYPKESYDEIINKLADGAQGKSAWRTNWKYKKIDWNKHMKIRN